MGTWLSRWRRREDGMLCGRRAGWVGTVPCVCVIVGLALLLPARAAHAAPERVTPIIIGQLGGDRRGDTYTHAGGDASIETVRGNLPVVEWQGRSAVKVHVKHKPGGNFHIGIARPGWARYYLDDYGPDATLTFDVAGSVSGDVRVAVVDTDPDGAGPEGSQSAEVDLAAYVQPRADWQRVAIPLRDFLAATPDLRLGSMEKVVINGSGQSGETVLYLADAAFRTTAPERPYPPVKVDQVGYRPRWRKAAKVTPTDLLAEPAGFSVLNADTDEAALAGSLKLKAADDPSSGDHVYEADFSALTSPGAYVVDVPGIGRSARFRIAEDVYDGLFYDVARFWFFQRCGTELEPEHAGPFAHRVCHAFDEAIPDPRGGTRDCRGGWHDAGDMNRYAAWTIHPVGMLLTLYRHYPDKFPDGQLNIPESGNGVPDLLDEVKYELQWVRKMLIREGPDAGMVYDRIHESGVQQPPGVDYYDRRHRLIEPTDEAACALVAGLAQGYLAFREFPQEEQFAQGCLQDALLSWKYLSERGRPELNHHFTAAVLLFEATGRADAHVTVKRLAERIMSEWHGQIVYRVMDLGLAAYVLSERPEVDRALQARLRQFHSGYADAVVRAASGKGYGEPMIDGVVFTWGSNGGIAKSGVHLLIANRHSPNPAYVETARETLHWLLGRNPVNTCMVTGYGEPALGPIYHGMFGPLGPGLPMPPGYVAGGVNQYDVAGISAYASKSWRPDHTCWQLTEPALGYQGPLTYLVGALAQLGEE